MPKSIKSQRSRPARTPEERENQLINMAMDLAERKIKDGSASSQLITHFLKLGTERERLENEKLRSYVRMADEKIEQMRSQEDIKELYENAIKAMKSYSGSTDEHDEDYYYEEDY